MRARFKQTDKQTTRNRQRPVNIKTACNLKQSRNTVDQIHTEEGLLIYQQTDRLTDGHTERQRNRKTH